jgi:hypothetical protein
MPVVTPCIYSLNASMFCPPVFGYGWDGVLGLSAVGTSFVLFKLIYDGLIVGVHCQWQMYCYVCCANNLRQKKVASSEPTLMQLMSIFSILQFLAMSWDGV